MIDSNKRSEGIYEKWRSTAALMVKGKTSKERLLNVLTAAICCVLAYILSARTLPYTALCIGIPTSDALLCASSLYTPFVFIGSVIGTIKFGYASIERFLTLGFIFVLRLITGTRCVSSGQNDDELFSEGIITKTAVAAVMSFIQCGMFLATNGINAQSAKNILATLTALPTLTLVFSVYYSKNDSTKLRRFLYELSMLIMFGCTVYCAKNLQFAFVEMDILLCVFFTLSVARYGGFARSTLTGFILGYICSPTYFICYLLLGATASITFSLGILSACGIALTVACACAVFLRGHIAIYTIIPDLILSSGIVWPMLKYSLLSKHFPYPFNDPEAQLELTDAQRIAYSEISSCSALRTLSNRFRALSSDINHMNQVLKDENHITHTKKSTLFEAVRNDFCEKCSMYPICHDTEELRANQSINDLITLCAEGNTPLAENIPIYLSSHCIRLRELTGYVKKLCIQQKTVKETQTIAPVTENSEIPPLISYACTADILTALAESFEKELCLDTDAQKRLAAAFHQIGLGFSGISVIGLQRKKVYVYGADPERIKKLSNEIHKSLQNSFGYSFSEPRLSQSEGFPIVFTPAPTLKVDAAVALSTKSSEPVSGDTVIAFNDEDENFYALISDGMGSGRAAQKSSVLTATLIKNLLIGRVDRELAIRITGDAVAKTCAECFSTVDLMKLDLISGKTTMTKSYAATSYVMRSGSVYCCDANSMPIGIDEENEPFETDFFLADGDTVVMISDGVADSADNSLGITDILGLHADLSPKQLADKIIERAIELNGKGDDMTALVVKIKKAA